MTLDFGKQLFEVMRRALDRGRTVEIEGLGIFRRGTDGRYALEPHNQPRVFVAYAAEDLELARRLCDSLRRAGCSPWLDKEKLLPGQNWPRAIERAIEVSDAFVACFSTRSIAKKGHFQCELRYALDCARRLPLESVFVIPVRFESCAVPKAISDSVQYVDLFPDWDRGVHRIIRVVLAAQEAAQQAYFNRRI